MMVLLRFLWNACVFGEHWDSCRYHKLNPAPFHKLHSPSHKRRSLGDTWRLHLRKSWQEAVSGTWRRSKKNVRHKRR